MILDEGSLAGFACGQQMMIAYLASAFVAAIYFSALVFAPILFDGDLIAETTGETRLAWASAFGLFGLVLVTIPVVPALGDFRIDVIAENGKITERYCRRFKSLERSIELNSAVVRYRYLGPKRQQLTFDQPDRQAITVGLYQSAYLNNVQAFVPVQYERHLELVRQRPFNRYIGPWEPYAPNALAP